VLRLAISRFVQLTFDLPPLSVDSPPALDPIESLVNGTDYSLGGTNQDVFARLETSPMTGSMTPNERLRIAVATAGLTPSELARRLGVDAKTVERWINTRRVPHSRHRWAACEILRVEETYLWPTIVDDGRSRSVTESELLTLYPNRGAVPRDVWLGLTERAREAIDILVYAGSFSGTPIQNFRQSWRRGHATGLRIRLLLGDPDSPAVLARGVEEGIGEAIAARIRISLAYLSALIATPGVELRLHGTTLYNSLYRFDNDLLVNAHVYGAPAAQSPVFHVRHLTGGRLFTHYLSSFDRVWDSARPSTMIGAQHGAA
jgi:transcriptional regulator with XRE-family HTH domain